MTEAARRITDRPGPWLELSARYADATRAAWGRRREMQGPWRNADELAFLPAALQLQLTPAHPAPRWAALSVMVMFAAAVGWACVGQVDVVAVAPGRIIVGERTKTIQPLERSVVRQVLVQDGDHVAAGQALVQLDPTAAFADLRSVEEQIKMAQSERIRSQWLQAALADAHGHGRDTVGLEHVSWPSDTETGAPLWSAQEQRELQAQMHSEWRDIQARLARATAELQRRRAEINTGREVLAKLVSTLPLVRQREQDFLALATQGFVAHHTGQDKTRERIEMERDLGTQQARMQESVAALAESESNQNAYLAETLRLLSERQSQAASKLQQASQEHAKAMQRERLTVLRSPVPGTVQQLAAHTSGGVVTEAQVLMVIVPEEPSDGDVVAEVVLDNKDIGFVRAGQSARIKLETFLFTRYGTISATVQRVTADAVNDDQRGAIFPARLQLDRNRISVDGKQIRLSPGMNVTAEIKTGQRRVIEYLLSPIQRAGGESLRER